MANTLTIRLGERERTRQESRERIAAAQRGESVDERHVLNIEREYDIARVLSEANIELLRTIAAHEPKSMRETATLVERDFKDVHRNLTELADLGIIEFVQDGQAKRPVVRFDELVVDIDLPSGEGDNVHAVA